MDESWHIEDNLTRAFELLQQLGQIAK